MHKKSYIMLRMLLNRYHGKDIEPLLHKLSEEDAKHVRAVSSESGNVTPYINQIENLNQNIHYSWLIAPIKNIENDKRSILLSLLPKAQASKIRKVLNDTSPPIELTGLGKKFFMNQLYPHILINCLPLEFVPETNLSFLAKLNNTNIIEIIDFLGLYDLGEEIQHIVDKHLLGQIYACLPKKKQLFLQRCLNQKEKLVTQRLKLENWNGDAQTFKKLLHHRGTVRLGYALSGENPDLIWHITHILDTGRGEKLSRYCVKEAIPGVTEALKKQVLTIIKFFKQVDEK